jgi:hypothetical protein
MRRTLVGAYFLLGTPNEPGFDCSMICTRSRSRLAYLNESTSITPNTIVAAASVTAVAQ